MSADFPAAVHDAVERLVMGFFMDLDTGNVGGLVDKMAPSGKWHRQGKVLSGRDSIFQAMAERGPNVRTAHLITNFHIREAGENNAVALFYMAAFRHEGAIAAGTPSPIALPSVIGLYECRCVRVDDDWHIEKLHSEPLFRG